MIYIYNPQGWPDAYTLARALREQGCTAAKATRSPLRHEVTTWHKRGGGYGGACACGEVHASNATTARALAERYCRVRVVCWGFPHDGAALNARIVGDKLVELQRFKEAHVRTVKFVTERPEGDIWMPRSRHHRSASDLITAPETPDFWVKRIPIVKEFRVHVFRAKSIRIGIKLPRDETAHPWIRSCDLGWRVDYGRACQENLVRGVRWAAKKAVTALGYDFGAVDVGVRPDGKAVVFEVNTAPGLKNFKTAQAYARHIAAALREER